MSENSQRISHYFQNDYVFNLQALMLNLKRNNQKSLREIEGEGQRAVSPILQY